LDDAEIFAVENRAREKGGPEMMKVEVRGAAAKIDALKRFDKEAWRDIQKGVKTATDAVTQDAKARVPFMGLTPKRRGTGWGKWIYSRDGRDLSYDQGKFRFTTRFRSKVKSGFRQVEGRAVLDKTDPAVAIFTLAGSVNKSRHPFNRNINKQTGTKEGARNVGMWPRLLTPAWYAKGPEAAKEIGQLIQAAVNKV
jgi:hypothetical protein